MLKCTFRLSTPALWISSYERGGRGGERGGGREGERESECERASLFLSLSFDKIGVVERLCAVVTTDV